MSRIRKVDEVDFGVYIWVTSQGILVDEDHNYLSIASMKGDTRRIEQLRRAAASYGYPEGKPHFMAGARKIDDEEYEHQKFRQKMGLLPDEFDVAALRDELRDRKS